MRTNRDVSISIGSKCTVSSQMNAIHVMRTTSGGKVIWFEKGTTGHGSTKKCSR